MDTLRELVASPLPTLRAETSHLLHLVISSDNTLEDQEELVSRMLLPAMVSLASDPEDLVKLSAVPGLAALLTLAFLNWEVSELGLDQYVKMLKITIFQEKEKISIQLNSLCEDPSEKVVLASLQQVGQLLPVCQEIRDQLLLPTLCSAPARWATRTFVNKQELCSTLLTSLSFVPELHAPGKQ